MKDIKKVLSIAGSDCSGGAGIQADIKTISAHNMYAMSVITSVTAQNTVGVQQVYDLPTDIVKSQIQSVFDDIRPDAVKIGMISNIEIISTIIECFNKYRPQNVVLDPVMVSTSGTMLLNHDALELLINHLFPFVTIITPNIPETQVLCKSNINNKQDMINAGKSMIERFDKAILIKGGHLLDTSDDLLVYSKEEIQFKWYTQNRISNDNTHGTGCTLSSAIACNLANGFSLEDSVKNAKRYITNAINKGLNLGKGNGPLWHF